MPILAHLLAMALIADGPAVAPDPKAGETWNLTLAEAIRIGLDNSEVVRVVRSSPGGVLALKTLPDPGAAREGGRADVVIARLNSDASIWNFKAGVMAIVRSIEQQYWALSQQQVNLWARETAVRLGEEILDRERADLEGGHRVQADIPEAEKQLANFKLNLVGATSDVITTERQFRKILGLPAADDRRIVPATPPVEAKVEPDWESCRRAMMDSQPDIVQQEQLIRISELQLLLARNQLLPPLDMNAVYQLSGLGQGLVAPGHFTPLQDIAKLMGMAEAAMHAAALDPVMPESRDFTRQQIGLVFEIRHSFDRPLLNTRQAQYQLVRQRAFLRQIVHQTSHSLARFFLEVDANYKQFETARRLTVAAQRRLEAQQAFYKEGRITVARLLDAIGQYADATAQEAQYKASYNASIMALEEAKGTLLAYDGIAVVSGPAPRNPYIEPAGKSRDGQYAPAALRTPLDGDVAPAAFEAPAPRAEAPRPAPTTYKLRAKLGGSTVLEVEVEVGGGSPAKPPEN